MRSVDPKPLKIPTLGFITWLMFFLTEEDKCMSLQWQNRGQRPKNTERQSSGGADLCESHRNTDKTVSPWDRPEGRNPSGILTFNERARLEVNLANAKLSSGFY